GMLQGLEHALDTVESVSVAALQLLNAEKTGVCAAATRPWLVRSGHEPCPGDFTCHIHRESIHCSNDSLRYLFDYELVHWAPQVRWPDGTSHTAARGATPAPGHTASSDTRSTDDDPAETRARPAIRVDQAIRARLTARQP